ncbi:hypothetical protein EDB84DRAFT_1433222 [Lactarius hengduanensis]|nr:hypothetical protein EDB84DRAFT_1433222 [Lactarius hengduanensis]
MHCDDKAELSASLRDFMCTLIRLLSAPTSREEVYAARAAYPSKDAGIIHLGTLPLLNAVINYATKLYLSVPNLPIYCKSGNVINELQIPRGTHLIISDIAYHRWPDHPPGTRRFGVRTQMSGGQLDGTVKSTGPNVGVWANLISFGAGHRACLGWRFARAALEWSYQRCI